MKWYSKICAGKIWKEGSQFQLLKKSPHNFIESHNHCQKGRQTILRSCIYHPWTRIGESFGRKRSVDHNLIDFIIENLYCCCWVYGSHIDYSHSDWHHVKLLCYLKDNFVALFRLINCFSVIFVFGLKTRLAGCWKQHLICFVLCVRPVLALRLTCWSCY